MNESDPRTPRPFVSADGEYQDPHYHDDDDEIDVNDLRNERRPAPAKKKPNRPPPPRRRYIDE